MVLGEEPQRERFLRTAATAGVARGLNDLGALLPSAKRLPLWVLLLALGACSLRPPAAKPPLATGDHSSAAAVKDLGDAVAFLKAVHPAPFRHVTEAELDSVVSQVSQRLQDKDEPSDLLLGWALHQVFGLVADSHIEVGLQTYNDDSVRLLPAAVIRIGKSYYLDMSNTDLPPGTEVISIGGEPIAELYASLSELVVVDGAQPTARRRLLERDFVKYYHLHAGLASSYSIEVRVPGGGTQQLSLAGVGKTELRSLLRARHSAPRWGSTPASRGPRWPELQTVGDGISILRVPTFGIPKQEEFAARVDRLMGELAGRDWLVIDVRGNEGGLRINAIAILNHLIPDPYRQWASMRTRVLRIPRRFRDRVSFPFGNDPRWLERGFRDHQTSPGGFRVDGDPLAERMKPRPQRFGGRVVVLVDALTNSAANTFVLALERFVPGTVTIGEQLGGACDSHVGEFPVVYVTANYGVAVLMSLIYIEHVRPPACEPGRGLKPDHVVDYTLDDMTHGRDPVLQRALSVTRN